MTRLALLLLASLLTTASAADAPPAPPSPLDFIDTSFENASPLWYEFATDGTVMVHLNYDHERNSPNRAAGHFHFRIQAPKGRKLTLEDVGSPDVGAVKGWDRTIGMYRGLLCG